ncbi:MAG TPA: SAM-dependent methyltransferase [Spirochaetia bacterium]|nr:MAG: methyltransferase type 11 [Spirochaetes bacterium GWB1_36_13]HCL55640.1 SAM-dependent methyltransferase [Spirochaetia bacterium]
MSNEEHNIHDFDISLICEYFSSMDRQGPGSTEATIKALSFIDNLHKNSKIADLGCGTGGQTIVLAQNTSGNITAIDLFPDFIDKLNNNVQKLNLQTRVKGVIGSMDKLDFQPNELDLIWSEGAIYNIGFEKGMNYWNNFLKKGGYVAVSEASWLTEERPKEIFDFWNEAYPEIDTIPNKIAQMQKAGYVVMAAFILPEYCWTQNFFIPGITAQKIFLDKYKGNQSAEEFIKYEKHHALLYDQYKDYYGYVFYIGKKI